ncbi:MAG: hypothetical protein E7621_01690 [Ruminococcaceae bacterium]|nr:hypothetical protein [Oscillospiraceae bacterium]
MFVTYQPARVIKSEEITISPKKSFIAGDDGLSARISFPEGVVVCGMSQSDKTKGYKTYEGEVIEFSGEVSVYNPTDAEKTIYLIVSDTF